MCCFSLLFFVLSKLLATQYNRIADRENFIMNLNMNCQMENVASQRLKCAQLCFRLRCEVLVPNEFDQFRISQSQLLQNAKFHDRISNTKSDETIDLHLQMQIFQMIKAIQFHSSKSNRISFTSRTNRNRLQWDRITLAKYVGPITVRRRTFSISSMRNR